MRFSIPVRLPSLANTSMHWRKFAALKVKQKTATHLCMIGAIVPPPPLLVTITRVGPRKLDDDNLASAAKYVRDQIAAEVGVDDGSELYTWRYEQRVGKSGEYNVEVEITAR